MWAFRHGMPTYIKAISAETPVLSGLLALRGGVEHAMGNAGSSTALYWLAYMPYLKMREVGLAIGTRYCQVAQLADRIESAIVVAAMGVLMRA